ncbi:MarR family winged helix-turn-helix transcriptional regulator [Limosilactobacillus pontis]|uniref:MarR family winged helix-turn-helix transcriptional regulator n=1 Tax=Limosilactobacillus pontis TaxID=35787 RepID=UPI001D1B8CD2|nr:MarR family transcriptional regulator [Limosilactobacillus pontis]HJE27412.1 MarR family winged helix-turn-helix transcriptional regulator [Limosilactobacillus pontis]
MDHQRIDRLNQAINYGWKGYTTWASQNGLTEYMMVILYSLLDNNHQSQHQLVEDTGYPKQSINKGIKKLAASGYLQMVPSPRDRRVRICQLTTAGQQFASTKLAPLLQIERRVVQEMGQARFDQLIKLNEEWSQRFWYYLEMGEDNDNSEETPQ